MKNELSLTIISSLTKVRNNLFEYEIIKNMFDPFSNIQKFESFLNHRKGMYKFIVQTMAINFTFPALNCELYYSKVKIVKI